MGSVVVTHRLNSASLQALERGAGVVERGLSYSAASESFWTRDRTWVTYSGRQIFIYCATSEVLGFMSQRTVPGKNGVIFLCKHLKCKEFILLLLLGEPAQRMLEEGADSPAHR